MSTNSPLEGLRGHFNAHYHGGPAHGVVGRAVAVVKLRVVQQFPIHEPSREWAASRTGSPTEVVEVGQAVYVLSTWALRHDNMAALPCGELHYEFAHVLSPWVASGAVEGAPDNGPSRNPGLLRRAIDAERRLDALEHEAFVRGWKL